MLSREIMGLLALGVLWVNTLLIAAAALKEVGRQMRLRASLAPVKGTVVRGDGEGGGLARHTVDQLGRSAGDPAQRRGILFHDRGYAGEIFGGAISTELGEVAIDAAKPARVWLPVAALRDAAACPSDEAIDVAFDDARRAKGFSRTVSVTIEPGREVWVAGELVREPSLRIVAPAGGELLVSTFEPRALLTRNIALGVFAALGFLAGAGVCTAITLTGPRFGTTSIVGAALGIVFFLLVQPAGTALRDAVRLPHVGILRGEWVRLAAPRAAASSEPAAPDTTHHAA